MKHENDYFVAIRHVGNTFAITARSTAKNTHWKKVGKTVYHTNDNGVQFTFDVIYDNLSGRDAKILKEYAMGGLYRLKREQIPNGA